MNAEVATDSALTVLNRHIAHMAESAIQSAAAVAATSSGATHQKSVEECVSYLSSFSSSFDLLYINVLLLHNSGHSRDSSSCLFGGR